MTPGIAAVAPPAARPPGWLGGHDFRVVNDWARHTGWLHGACAAWAKDGVVLFGLLLVAGWWLARRSGEPRRMAAALWAAAGTLVAVAVNQPIVHDVHEARPYAVLPHVLVLVHRSVDPSFPSDHATMAGAVTAGLLLVDRRLGVGAGLAALLMAFARVYVGVHYPRDVVAGLLLGAAVVAVGALLVVPPLARLVARLSTGPLAPLLRARHPAGRSAGRPAGEALPG